MAVTLKDIARESGVSLQTASRILRGQQAKHSPETCARVLAVAKELAYEPNPISRALLGQSSMTVGLLVRGFGSRLTIGRIRSAMVTAMESGYLTYLMHLDYGVDESESFARAVRELVSRRVDGLVIYRSLPLPPGILALMAKQSIPVVYMDWAPGEAEAGPNAGALMFDRKPGINEITRRLAELGHRKAALFISRDSADYPQLKIMPYQEACQAAGIALNVQVEAGLSDSADAEHHAYQVVSRHIAQKTGATAYFMNNDECAIGALAAARDAGLVVPRDLSIVGFNDIAGARYAKPSLTTVRECREEAGKQAMEMLIQRIKHPEQASQRQTLEFNMVYRESTGPAPQV